MDATVRLARELRTPVIASGGVTNLDDVKALCAIAPEGVVGVVTGRALYQGTLDLRIAQAEADKLSGKADEE
jgi:phosphoribosylformimino-5-aminoimidazole carboxamide ribotide isomerase